jgi:hypothetical protein
MLTATGTPLSDHYGIVVTLRDIKYDCGWLDHLYYYCPDERLSLEKLPIPQKTLARLCTATDD